jgi:tetratricopeptide (TPR) repeat protein
MKILLRIAVVTVLVATSPYVQANPPYCGDLYQAGQYGPWDYTNNGHRTEKLPIVENYHFTAGVRNLIKGETDLLGADIGYTLTAFPNHHIALAALSKLSIREKDVRPLKAPHSVECFFDRAIRFKPSDGIVRMIYGNYLVRVGRKSEAVEQLEVANKIAPDNANILYNLGLLHFNNKNYEEATMFAKQAYGLGFPLPGLRNKLKRAGKWDGTLDESVNEEKNEGVDEDE